MPPLNLMPAWEVNRCMDTTSLLFPSGRFLTFIISF